MKTKAKNIILIVGMIASSVIGDLKKFQKREAEKGKKLRFVLMHDRKNVKNKTHPSLSFFDAVHKLDFKVPGQIVNVIKKYEGQLLAATCRAESQIPNFIRVIPYISYLPVPTSESLKWTTEKSLMRKRFSSYDPSITPKFMVVKELNQETIEEIKRKIGFPLVIKPSGLAQSLLVTITYHEEELEKSLKKAFKKIRKLYKDASGRGEPEILVEEFLDGKMYSFDAYVNRRGVVYFCPIVAVKTGREIGFDDFFGYLQTTPVKLKKETIKEAEEVSEKAIKALGLRSSTAHIELMRTESGWKIIEIGPRVGGFRSDLYKLSFGIDHSQNDIFIRIPKKPIIPKKVRGYSAAMKFFASKEGVIKAIIGARRAKRLKSFHSISLNKNVGDRASYAKNGGKSIFNIILFHEDRSQLLADIRRLEQMVNIKIGK